MNFIKKIVDKNFDDSVHSQFQKFSRGEFKNRAVIKAKNSGGKYSITTTAEFANEFVRTVAEKLGGDKVNVTGVVVSTADLTGELDFKNKKQFQGVKSYVMDAEMSSKDILGLLNKFPKAFFALSFEAENGETKLKIKAKAPKSGKPGSKGEEAPNPDFCRFVTRDKKIAESFIFEKPDFKDALINHTFLIEEIIFPQGEKDFAKIRELAKRKGKIIRKTEIDGQKSTKEIDFEA